VSTLLARFSPAATGRASAHYNLDEKISRSAMLRIVEMQPNALALWILGDLAKDKHDEVVPRAFGWGRISWARETTGFWNV